MGADLYNIHSSGLLVELEESEHQIDKWLAFNVCEEALHHVRLSLDEVQHLREILADIAKK